MPNTALCHCGHNIINEHYFKRNDQTGKLEAIGCAVAGCHSCPPVLLVSDAKCSCRLDEKTGVRLPVLCYVHDVGDQIVQ